MAPGAMLIPLDAPETTARLARCATDNPCSNTGPHDLAYVIYTSGTTGYPKGTLIEQRCVNRLVINPNYVEIGEQDRILGISGYQFDASIYDIFGALLNGAALVIADKPNILDLDRLSQLIVDCQISNFFATTAFFNTLVDAELPGLQQLNYLLFGGEQVSVNHVNRFRALYPQVKLVHVYGPTETTTYATAYLTNTASQAFDYTVPIGQPISNTQLYILDEQLRPSHKVRLVSCISVALALGAAIRITRSRQRTRLLPIRSAVTPSAAVVKAPAFIKPGIKAVTCRTVTSNIWAAMISRSRSVASVLSRGRLKPG